MAVLHFGEWKIQVDVEKTKQYYDAFSVADEDAQGYRNYAAFCNDLLDEEKAFFESFGIEASCCNVMSIGLTEDKRYPTAGGYCFAGRFLEKPEEHVMTMDELVENDFVDDRPDPRVYIGRYHFTFMDPDSLFARIPEGTPEGFLYMEFFLEDMPWLLNEKPEMTMFYPPKPWQLFQKLHLKFQQRKENHEYIEELKGSLIKLFQNKHIEYSEMSKSSLKKYTETWFVSIVPKMHQTEAREHCFSNRKVTNYLWHAFSYGDAPAFEGDRAKSEFDHNCGGEAVVILNYEKIGFILKNCQGITAGELDEYNDIIISDKNFDWTYVHTHEAYCGPYFFQRGATVLNLNKAAKERIWTEDKSAYFEVLDFIRNEFFAEFFIQDFDDDGGLYYREYSAGKRITGMTVEETVEKANQVLMMLKRGSK